MVEPRQTIPSDLWVKRALCEPVTVALTGQFLGRSAMEMSTGISD